MKATRDSENELTGGRAKERRVEHYRAVRF